MNLLKSPLLGSLLLLLCCCAHACSDNAAPPSPAPPPIIALQRVFPDLPTFDAPLALLQAPGDANRWFVVQQNGIVYTFDNTPEVNARTEFVDVSALVDATESESGLLGMAFHPDFPTTPEVFLSYTAPGLESHLARFTSSDGGATLNPASEEVLLTRDQPYNNHNGGGIVFGPDGFLYMGLGDGGSGGDPDNNAQDTSNMLGTILRLDVDNADGDCTLPYEIPAGNPFASPDNCPTGEDEDDVRLIYAWGLRNPWRFSFDSAPPMGAPDPALWVGDVGQGDWEEVDLVEAGGNYGWHCREGLHPYTPAAAQPECIALANAVDPLAEYSHAEGISITGGYVYRGSAVEDIAGAYLYADFGTGSVWALRDPYGENPTAEKLLTQTNVNVSSFGRDADGELYVLHYGGGTIYKIVPAE